MRPRISFHNPGCLAPAILLTCLWCPGIGLTQQIATDVPAKFNVDLETAARLRPQLVAQSSGATGRYTTGQLVFEGLLREARSLTDRRPSWELRVTHADLLNAFSSPDGTIYVGRGLARLAGQSAGLWAAILSHEIAHVVRRDWARRYRYEKSLSGGATVGLGDPGHSAGTWTDPRAASEELAGFCRGLELDADFDGLMLMARAGYHPDFVPALHHLMHAQSSKIAAPSQFAMHPYWEVRDHQLERAYITASIEFARRWPEWYASPGGNPPTLVFAEEPRVKKTRSKDLEIEVPIHCENLVGAVEVVLLTRLVGVDNSLSSLPWPPSTQATRQLTGCTSPKTTIVFNLTVSSPASPRGKGDESSTDVYVLDNQGSVLSRAEVPNLHR